MFSRALCLFSAGLLLAQPGLLKAQPHDPAAIARKALDLMLGEKYSDLEQMITPAYREHATAADLAKVGAQIKAWGAVEEIGKASVQDMGPVSVVTIPVKFATRPIDVQMSVNASGQVSPPLLRPGATPWQPPAYAKQGSYKERPVTIGDEWKLPGTLTVPTGSGPFPAVVLVHGFGANDRDETAGAIKMFRDLAYGLASKGIVVLRYEKRTKEYSARMTGMAYTADEEVVEDAVKALAVLRGQPEVDGKRVYALGHDFGGYLLPRIASEDGKLAGLILMGSAARPLEDLILEKVVEQKPPANVLAAAKEKVAKVKKLEAADEDGPPILGLPVAYWVDLRGYDAIDSIKKLGIPVMVLQGERDFQTGMTDFNLWKQAVSGGKGSSAQSFPALNHLFVSGQGKSTEAEYRTPGHVAPEIIDLLAQFIH